MKVKIFRFSKKIIIILLCIALATAAFSYVYTKLSINENDFYAVSESTTNEPAKKFIKWVNFGVSYTVLKQAMDYDIKSQAQQVKLNWIELLSYAACKNGGKFQEKPSDEIERLVKRIQNGETIEEITKDMKHYNYYFEAYSAVLGGFLGDNNGKYGLQVYSPIAKGFGYSHCSDFGMGRSYGYDRKHLGNDLMGSVGTPIVAVESGIIENMGWNKYGGWRIGIRSYDSKRYYYYAHLRKDHPYNNDLKEGMEVKAGDVIGYLGMTGYSDNENINGMQKPHLHFGVQLIFDESQKEGYGEIWIDVYNIIRLLQSTRSKVVKDTEKKEYYASNN
ncbi:MAG: M23 family metallopeptidase [Clostridia bacterium]|nr:M23 family metallopeptidase [Clostridia bacterium]